MKFLGLYIDEHLTWSHHFKNVQNKLSKSVYILNSVKKSLPTYCMRSLYYSFVNSHINYGIMLWGPNLSKKIQTAYSKLKKKLLELLQMLDTLLTQMNFSRNWVF